MTVTALAEVEGVSATAPTPTNSPPHPNCAGRCSVWPRDATAAPRPPGSDAAARLQVMTDEMRMAGYNHIYLSLAVILFCAPLPLPSLAAMHYPAPSPG